MQVGSGSSDEPTRRATSSPCFNLYLLDSACGTLERSVNDGSGTDESVSLTRTASGTGTYYADIEPYAGSGGDPYTCTLTKS
ncbi:hypothetical protein ACFXA4_05390 [Streptomyces sp. NPDC059442]|uniref:hypothetical protein n=1 Tax=Streptomyces sp. NPDC059442 TaxID=3346830 RepID=UPI0036A71D92